MNAVQIPGTLARGEMLRLRNAAGSSIHVDAGRLWITQENEGVDYIVEAGETFVVCMGGVTLVTALRPSALAH